MTGKRRQSPEPEYFYNQESNNQLHVSYMLATCCFSLTAASRQQTSENVPLCFNKQLVTLSKSVWPSIKGRFSSSVVEQHVAEPHVAPGDGSFIIINTHTLFVPYTQILTNTPNLDESSAESRSQHFLLLEQRNNLL